MPYSMKKKFLKHLLNTTYIQVKRSGLEGVGIFAIRNIPKGY
jgi:hypothetical protein